MSAEQTFRAKAPGIVLMLLGDFPLDPADGFAIVGNAGHESAGFTILQEIKPTVKGSKGGWGWFQWTGSRRRAFEAYCKRNKLDPASDKANYAWLFIELKGDERKAIGAVRAAANRDAKVVAFEAAYERAGVKHYDSRRYWASIAADAYVKAGPHPSPTPLPDGKAILTDEAKASTTKAAQQVGGAAGVGAGGVGADQVAHLPTIAIIIVALLIAAPFVYRALKNLNRAAVLTQAAKEA